MTITKRTTAKLSRASVSLTRVDGNGDPVVIFAQNVEGVAVDLFYGLEDWDILRELVMGFDVHEALQLEEDAKASAEKVRYARCPADNRVLGSPLVLGARLHSDTPDAEGDDAEDDTVDPVGGDMETATMLKSKTHDCWVEVVPNFENGPRYVLHFRAVDGALHSRTGDVWNGNRELAIKRLHELEKSGEAMVRT